MTDASLRSNRNYRLVFSASVITNLGDGITVLALPWLATLMTRDPVLIATVAMAGRLPWLLFTLPAGVLTDRADRRKLIARADILRGILMLAVMGLALSPGQDGTAAVLAVSALAFLLGAAEVLRDNAAQTILPDIVAPDQLEAANGRMWSAELITNQFLGPPLAGALIGVGIAVPFGVDAVTLAIAAGLVWLVVLPPMPARNMAPFWPALVEGIRWLRAHKPILQLAITLGVINFFWMAELTVLVLFSQEVLGLTAFGHGLLLTAGAVGGVAGALLSPRIHARIGLHRSLILAIAGFAAAYAVMTITASPFIAALALCVESLAALLWNVITVSYRQRHIPAGILGRVNSIYRFFAWGSMPAGAMVAGGIVAVLETDYGREVALRSVFGFAATGTALVGLWAARSLRLP
jgi:MFS family permease